MRQFALSLLKDEVRPVIILKNWKNYHALLDTGALIPVWTGDESVLKDLSREYQPEEVTFSGFGGEARGNLYFLPTLQIGELKYTNLPVVACSNLGETHFQLILSATMFHNLTYAVDDKNHKFAVSVPDDESYERFLRIRKINGKLQVLYSTDDEEPQRQSCCSLNGNVCKTMEGEKYGRQ